MRIRDLERRTPDNWSDELDRYYGSADYLAGLSSGMSHDVEALCTHIPRKADNPPTVYPTGSSKHGEVRAYGMPMRPGWLSRVERRIGSLRWLWQRTLRDYYAGLESNPGLVAAAHRAYLGVG